MKYTYKDIIIDPRDPRLEGAIGKKVYACDLTLGVLQEANGNYNSKILNKIVNGVAYPFWASNHPFLCIIIKKEPEVKYVPFDLSKKEDRDFLRGKWIRHKVTGDEYQITVLSNNLAISCTGKELLKYFTFLDGTPVGKKVEE